MACEEALADRLREALRDEKVTEKKMFGGLAFLIEGNMAIAASGQGGLLLRCDPAATDDLLRLPHAECFVMRGSAMNGWLRVNEPAFKTKRQLERWVKIGVDYARSLPPKAKIGVPILVPGKAGLVARSRLRAP
jgi:TfoX/Sxy family transcriptional regulator of competence genes